MIPPETHYARDGARRRTLATAPRHPHRRRSAPPTARVRWRPSPSRSLHRCAWRHWLALRRRRSTKYAVFSTAASSRPCGEPSSASTTSSTGTVHRPASPADSPVTMTATAATASGKPPRTKPVSLARPRTSPTRSGGAGAASVWAAVMSFTLGIRRVRTHPVRHPLRGGLPLPTRQKSLVRRQRQPHLEPRAGVQVVRRQRATMGLHQTRRDGQAQPRSAG